MEASDEYKLEGFKIVLKASLASHSDVTTDQRSAQFYDGGAHDKTAGSSEKWTKDIAAKLGISAESVSNLYHYPGEGQLDLIIESKDLPKTNSKSTQHIAALLSAGRQAIGIDRATSLEEIRKACDHYRVYDAKNFSSYVKALGSKFRFDGDGSARTVELTNGAFTATGEIAKKYLGV